MKMRSGSRWSLRVDKTRTRFVLDNQSAFDQNYPNQASIKASTVTKDNVEILITPPMTTNVGLLVYDPNGGMCKSLVSGNLSAGTHQLNVNLDLPSGIYFNSLTTESGVNTVHKFLLVK